MQVLITGSASGIGACVVDAMLARGASVVASDVDEAALAAQADRRHWSDERVRRVRLDVRSADDWRAAIAAAIAQSVDEQSGGRLDVLCNVAGYLQPGYAHEVALEHIDRHLDINVKGVMLGTRLAAERMVAQGGGHIINIASMAAFAPVPGLCLYSASKYAVRAFSLAAGLELREHGVAVTVVCPDAVATPMLDKQKDYREAAMTFTAPRVLAAEEVAAAIAGQVLDGRPLEIALPATRKWLARVADLFPELGARMLPLFRKQGIAKQKRARQS